MIKRVKVLEVSIDGSAAGRLGLDRNGRAVFEYSAGFLKKGFSLSPFYLPLKSGVFTAKPDPFYGMFGVFSDSLPDGWGRLLIDRLLKKLKYDPQELTELDRLSITGAHGMGALEYHPESSAASGRSSADVARLAAEVKKVLNDSKSADLDLLVKREGSSAGARPKAMVKYAGSEWIVKFPGYGDSAETGALEYEYSLAAKKCGIEMSQTRLFKGKYFGTKRFDRTKTGKIHMISAAALLNADFRQPSLDYLQLMRAAMAITGNFQEVLKLFRLMVFNVLSKNRDDHAKNFSFLYKKGRWFLSPAYDLIKSSGFNGQHTTTVMGSGTPGRKEIMECAKEVNINKKTAESIYEQVSEALKTKS